MTLSKGFSNLFKPTIINFILAGCIIIILILIFLHNGKIDLFTNNDIIPSTTPNSGIALLTGNDYLTTFINKYINNIQQQNTYMQTLTNQQQTINNLTQQVAHLVNTSS